MFALLKLAIFVAPIFAAPSSLVKVAKYDGAVRTNGYIVTLKASTLRAAHIESLNLSPESKITHEWDNVFNGFAGTFTEEDLEAIRANPDVAAVEEDGVVTTFTTQTNAPWGLSRLSSSTKLSDQHDTDLTFSYTYDASAGSGVDVYVIDTGIYTSHSDFGGRASWGTTFGGYPNADGNGHGTHVAGTAISKTYGVAKAAHAIAVKVLDDSGSGFLADVISGIEWAADTASSTGRPSVASLSLGGGASTAVDNAIAYITNAGFPVAVAAGNDNTDAKNTSPARAPSAVTVGASDITDARAYFSNYGSVVDIFAPGLDVTSTWNNGGTNTISGTSMATPHVSGLIAYLLGLDPTLSVSAVASTLKSAALSGSLSALPSGTANLLAHNAF